jgi:hypothetical protein
MLPTEGRRRGGWRHGGRASASGGEAEGTIAAAMSEEEGRATGAMPCDGHGGGYSEGESRAAARENTWVRCVRAIW